MENVAKWLLFTMRERATTAGRIADVDAIDGIMDAGLDEAARHDWRLDYLRWEQWGEYPSWAYCDVCDGLMFIDDAHISRRCRCNHLRRAM
jgi:hypothetical protein